MYTQCPECLTYFQVTPEHLKIAQGNVRCGQCRNVFSALGNLTEDPPASAYQSIPSKQEPDAEDIIEEEELETKTANKKVANVPNTNNNQKIAPTRSAKAKPTPPPIPKQPDNPKFKPRPVPKVAPQPDIEEEKPESKSRLGQAIAAIKALNISSTAKLPSLEEGRDTYIAKIKNNFAKLESNLKKEVKKHVQIVENEPTQEKPKSQKNNIQAPIKKPTTQPVKPKSAAIPKSTAATTVHKNNITPKPSPVQPVREPTRKTTPTASNESNLEEVFQAIDEIDLDNHVDQAEHTRASKDTANSNVELKVKPLERKTAPKIAVATESIGAYNAAFESTKGQSLSIIPKQLIEDFRETHAAPLIHSRHHTLWSVGSIVLMMTFLLQTIYFKHNDLAKIQQIRPWIETLCGHLACDLSLPSDIKKLELLGQDIRSHPKVKNALLVSTTIINNAKYVQTYPVLQITFSNMNGEKVAMRQFQAPEYLPPNTEFDKGMQPNTPIQIELEVIDPGANAVNFEFNFLPSP